MTIFKINFSSILQEHQNFAPQIIPQNNQNHTESIADAFFKRDDGSRVSFLWILINREILVKESN
jgi:hypothetical protein